MDSTRFSAVITILLGAAAIILPHYFGTFAVMLLGGIMMASGLVSLFYAYQVRKQGLPVSVFGPWAQVIVGLVILVWPELTLWLLAVLLDGGLILRGITGLTAIKDSGVVNPPVLQKVGLWASIVLGAVLIVLGSFGSAVLLGFVLGIALIGSGLYQWRWSTRWCSATRCRAASMTQ